MIKLEEFTTPALSKKIKVSKSRPDDSTKAEEGKLSVSFISSLGHTKSKVLGKRPRNKNLSKKFIDDEAEESDGESELKEEKREISASDLLNRKANSQTYRM